MSGFKACVLGASGGIGQTLCMLLKVNPQLAELALYDVKQANPPCPGVAADLSHIDTACQVKGYSGDEELGDALTGSHVVIMTASKGVLKPGMTRDDLFKFNANIMKSLAEACAKYCPNAVVLIISNPVNSMVPLACEVFKSVGCFDWRKILGVTTLDCVRTVNFVAEKLGVDAKTVQVPVIGGHAGKTIMPVFSKATPAVNFSQEEVEALDKRIQDAAFEVVNAKAGAGSATMSMAYAAAKLADVVLAGLAGEPKIACAFVGNRPAPGPAYFSLPCVFGTEGVEDVQMPTDLTPYEQKRLAEVEEILFKEIAEGVDYFVQHL